MNNICNIKLSLGLLLLHNPDAGDQTECRDLLESGLELTVREKILSLEPHFHINLCELSLQGDDLTLAREHAERAVYLARSIVEPSAEAGAILYLGRVSNAEGDFGTALDLYQTSLQQAQTLQDSALIFDGLLALASLRMKTGDMRSAEFALAKICEEAAPESWYRREAIRLLTTSNLKFKIPLIVADG